MRILWVSNSPLGPAADVLGMEYDGSSGGWIRSEFDKINKSGNEFFFLCSSREIKKKQVVHRRSSIGEAFCVHSPRLCYGIKNPKYLSKQVQDIVSTIAPDIIHIWGTETCISNIVANIQTNCPKVVFLQGLLGIHKRYLGGYQEHGDRPQRTLKEGVVNSIRTKSFIKQARIEQDTILKCGNVIGDGTLALSYVRSVNKNLRFYRYVLLPNKAFSEKCWNNNYYRKHTVFTIYSGNAEKGLQQLLKAVALVKRDYPDVLVIIPGNYHIDQFGKLSGCNEYEKFLQKIIKDNELQNNVRFVGKLNAAQMAEQMKNANCFVNPSIMENHALSLREAMCVGVPCISTICGNVTDYLNHGKNGFLYRFEEYEVLAEYINKVFSQEFEFVKTDALKNSQNLCDIYEEIVT